MSELILILDDEVSYATMVSDLLVSHGYCTDVCTQPREALERLHQHSYGLIITDYKMPDVDGAELLGEVRKVLPHIPVIMISGLMGKDELLRVANIGVTLVLEKPFNVPTFLEHVSHFVHPSEGSAQSTQSEQFDSTSASSTEDDSLAYPRPTTCVVDESRAMQKFLNRFWTQLEDYPHVPIVVPEGGEFEAIVRQATEWVGHADTDPLRMTLTELDRADARGRLIQYAAAEGASPLVAITVPDQSEVDLRTLERFFAWTREEATVAERLRFVYGLPDVIEAHQFEPTPDFADSVSKPLALPPMRERLVDLGGWVARTLSDLGPDRVRPLSAAAVDLLLHGDWPGNHHELVGTVRRAVAIARLGEISVAAVRLAMKGHHQTPPAEESVQGIASYLLAEQGRFLEQHLPKKDRFEALSRMVGGQFDRLRADREINEQPLLFEELAKVAPEN